VPDARALVLDRLRARIDADGPVPFSAAMELALYDPDGGFYATGGRAGRRGDFLTSPEVGPLFGAVVARALDAWWEDAGRPDPWSVVEAGAGPGTLARTVRAAAPACLGALRWILVERSAAQRELHQPIVERAAAALGAAVGSEVGAVVSRADLPAPAELEGPVVVLANELLDNLPFDLLERTAEGWSEVRVGSPSDGGDEDLVEVLVPFEGKVPAGGADAPVGARIPLQRAAGEWLREALALARAGGPGGRLVVIDYASTTADLATRPMAEWLRTYRAHGRGGPPLDALGTQDITCEVAVDQLAEVAEPTSEMAQADWLRAHGLEALVEEGRAIWQARAGVGDLPAVKARSRITEAEALADPSGLGAFRALEWAPG
jgi:SAM-dependent MidA family methyltransferase